MEEAESEGSEWGALVQREVQRISPHVRNLQGLLTKTALDLSPTSCEGAGLAVFNFAGLRLRGLQVGPLVTSTRVATLVNTATSHRQEVLEV